MVVVVVGIDGGAMSERVVSAACNVILGQDSVGIQDNLLVLVSCVSPETLGIEGRTIFGKELVLSQQEKVSSATQLLTEYVERVRGLTIPCKSVLLEHKNVGEAIVKLTLDVKADFVVVGSRVHGVVERTILGSVSNYIIQHSSCSALIVNYHHDIKPPERIHKFDVTLSEVALSDNIFRDIIEDICSEKEE